jgi:hypothetical protein
VGGKGKFYMTDHDDLYDYPADHVGRKTYVSIKGHVRSVPKYKTYLGDTGHRHIHPDYGGDWSGYTNQSALVIRDKEAYWSPLDGTTVEGRSAHREHMRKHNVIEVGDQPVGSLKYSERSPMEPVGLDIVNALRRAGH